MYIQNDFGFFTFSRDENALVIYFSSSNNQNASVLEVGYIKFLGNKFNIELDDLLLPATTIIKNLLSQEIDKMFKLVGYSIPQIESKLCGN